jgi:hypothetical protein
MLRLTTALVAVLALTGAMTVAVSPASAYSGAAYNKCMEKCRAGSFNQTCANWCERRH